MVEQDKDADRDQEGNRATSGRANTGVCLSGACLTILACSVNGKKIMPFCPEKNC